jgi:hypothetical protein
VEAAGNLRFRIAENGALVPGARTVGGRVTSGAYRTWVDANYAKRGRGVKGSSSPAARARACTPQRWRYRSSCCRCTTSPSSITRYRR